MPSSNRTWSMPMFVVKRDLPRITGEVVQAAGLRVKTYTAEMRGEGNGVRARRRGVED